MKTINVVAAIITSVDENGNKTVLATQRGYGDFKGGWEFPGGKIENGETPQEALAREIREELKIEIEVGQLLDTVDYTYPTFNLIMECFWAVIKSGNMVLMEHESAKWLTPEKLYSVEWLPADLELIDKIKDELTISAIR